ncbi:antirepressor regulating drug resistance protein [Thermobacillus composti KWC4]|uniref:Antirepressor regulating drug resistance protein n=1 Tax=Thermobacillus composti (strain DSM 18247 / JCM 13945 / KWC4) TaxID=717605 RepID=L0EID8_THECK|nr:M56 family metallopeptidase [Thermobacillus composti]AGA59582.1 antirepressor regulating drug resistance protein [Thermobacillus composti KWC4]
MTNLFFTVVNMSIAAGFTALVVIAARLALRRAPAVLSYLLWIAVAVRLVIPVRLASPLSIMRPIEPLAAEDSGFMTFVSPELKTTAMDAGMRGIERMAETMMPAAKVPGVDMLDMLIRLGGIIWIIGVIVLLARSAVNYWNVRNSIRTAVRIRDHIYESDRIDTPFVFGLLKPKIYVPTGLSEQELTYVLLHEQTHIDRRDYVIKPLAYIMVIIHWFNPLIWLSYALMSKDMEMSCDEKVLDKTGGRHKRPYAAALLSCAVRSSGLRAGSSPAFGENQVKARIRNILAYRKPSARVIAGYMLAIAVLIAACSTNPKMVQPVPHTDRQTFYSGYNLTELMNNKTLYVGHAGKVGGLIHGMPEPEGLDWNGIELQTTEPPYGVIIRYQMNAAADQAETGDAAYETFCRNAVLLFSLIDNVDRISLSIGDQTSPDGSASYSMTVTREQAEAWLGGDVRPYSADASGLQRLIDQVNRLSFDFSQS